MECGRRSDQLPRVAPPASQAAVRLQEHDDLLDIAEFHKAMLGVAHFFEAVDTMIDHEQDQKNEYRQYMWERQHEYEADYYD